MSTTTDHLIDAAGCASAAVAGGSGKDADVKSMPVSENDRPASRWRSSAALAAEKVRRDALRLMGGDRLRPFRPRLLPVRARRTGALDERVLSLTAKGLTSGLPPCRGVRDTDFGSSG
ncbi:hypothetical protein ACFZDK_54350 [Streptomyces sp. NPDC007901]|uniref:hypothetical protein n=1 Tax=Streptomyces sp. NPDC007901 TaxID=3364785 RepID=UPI0036E945B1